MIVAMRRDAEKKDVRSVVEKIKNAGLEVHLSKGEELTIIVDPSHGTGRSDLVAPMSRAAVAVGADGLIIEVHPRPEKAMVDGPQSLNFGQFKELMKEIKPIAKALGREI